MNGAILFIPDQFSHLHLGQMTYGINPTKLNLAKVITLYSEELDRMEKKTPEQMLKVELENEFGFSPIVARALLNKIESYNSYNKTPNLSVGTIFYLAASSREPAGKAIEEMNLKQVKLTLNTNTDISILRESGMQALREAKGSPRNNLSKLDSPVVIFSPSFA